MSYGYGFNWASVSYIRSIASIAVILMYFKLFYWMRLFGSTSYFIRMIIDTFVDIQWFVLLFFMILFTFGNAIYILNYNRTPTPEEMANLPEDYEPPMLIVEHFPGAAIVNIFINQYLLALGEFEGKDNFDEEDSAAVWIFFLLATFITQITFLNMLIAIMGDTYAKVTETKDQSALSERIKILADYVSVVNDNEKNDQYLVMTKPSDSESGDSWEGTVSTIKKSLDKAVSDMTGTFNKKFGLLTSDL